MITARLLALVGAALFAACGPPAADAPPRADPRADAREAPKDVWIDTPTAAPLPPPPPQAAIDDGRGGKDFIDEARVLFRVAACGSDDPVPADLDASVIKAHCDEIRPKIEAYKRRYVAVAKPFLGAILPRDVPDEVVYPFGGGDLVTALTTYPTAKEITTLSLELTGDPRRIRGMRRDDLEQSLAQLRRELAELFFVDDYSKSETLKRTQRGDIPGELVLFLVGLSIHGYQPVSLRYFAIDPDGAPRYLSERAIEEADHSLAVHRKSTWWPPDFAESFANAEIAFRPAGAPASEPARIHRHIAQNLSNEGIAASPFVMRHLERKEKIAAMTKAASYLLWNDAFSTIRSYLLDHMTVMISDSTGIPPSIASSAGFTQETYGSFNGSLLRASPRHNGDFRALWRSQPKRKLPFRYGYLSAHEAHLVITKKRP